MINELAGKFSRGLICCMYYRILLMLYFYINIGIQIPAFVSYVTKQFLCETVQERGICSKGKR